MQDSIFSGMSPDEVRAIYQRYRAGEKPSKLLDELGQPEMPGSRFYLVFDGVRANDLSCAVCDGSPMLASLPSKSTPLGKILHTCLSCGHRIMADIDGGECEQLNSCQCLNCVKARKDAQDLRLNAFVEKIRSSYGEQSVLQNYEIPTLELSDLITIHSLINTWASEELTHLVPYQERLEILWPTRSKSLSSLSALYKKHVLQVDLAHCTTKDFVEEKDGSVSWYAVSASLRPSIEDIEEHRMDIPQLQGYLRNLIPGDLTNDQKSELLSLMQAIAVDECVQFMDHTLEDHGFDYEVGEKTEKIFYELLEQLPVSQILVCIWTAVKGAAAFMQTPGCKNRKHAFNTIPAKLRDTAQRRITGEYEGKGFDRNKYCPRSEVSYGLYGLLGFDGDIGFEKRLADIPIPEEWQYEDEDYGQNQEYLSFTKEELVILGERGFVVLYGIDAEREFIYSGQKISIYKTRENSSPFYEMVVSADEQDKSARGTFSTFAELLIFLSAFENSDQFAESMG